MTSRSSVYLRALMFFVVLLLVMTSGTYALNLLFLMCNVVAEREAFQIWMRFGQPSLKLSLVTSLLLVLPGGEEVVSLFKIL